MAVRNDFTAGEVLAAADLNDTFLSKLNLAGGKILQTISVSKNDTQTVTSGTFVDVTGLSVSITPTLSTSKILVFGSISLGASSGSSGISARLVRGATAIGGSVAAGSRSSGFGATSSSTNDVGEKTIIYLDSPNTTSSTTYKLQVITVGTCYINRSNSDSDEAWNARGVSSITVMEVSA
jgi:hypothetical protein